MKLEIGFTKAKFTFKQIIENPNGEVRKYLPRDLQTAGVFKEIYISKLLPGKSKKWKCNKRQSQNLCAAEGRLSVICIERIEQDYIYEEFLLDDSANHGVLEIPAGIIYGLFTDDSGALIINALSGIYSEDDSQAVEESFDLHPALL
jgi:hypothetical protein